jgi:hypothetical protein
MLTRGGVMSLILISFPPLISFLSLFDQRNETFLEGNQVKGTEHNTAPLRKLKERKMISIIVSLIMSFQE